MGGVLLILQHEDDATYPVPHPAEGLRLRQRQNNSVLVDTGKARIDQPDHGEYPFLTQAIGVAGGYADSPTDGDAHLIGQALADQNSTPVITLQELTGRDSFPYRGVESIIGIDADYFYAY
jgi:hypothetical protein